RRRGAALRLVGAVAHWAFRHVPLVPTAAPVLFDDRGGIGGHLLAFQVVINMRVGNTKGLLIRKARFIVFQISSWYLAPCLLRRFKVLQHLCPLALVEPF